MVQLIIQNKKLYANKIVEAGVVKLVGEALYTEEIHRTLQSHYRYLYKALTLKECYLSPVPISDGYIKCTVAMQVNGRTEQKHYRRFTTELNNLWRGKLIVNRFLAPITKVRLPGEEERWLIVAYTMTPYHIHYLKTKSDFICDDHELGYLYKDEENEKVN